MRGTRYYDVILKDAAGGLCRHVCLLILRYCRRAIIV